MGRRRPSLPDPRLPPSESAPSSHEADTLNDSSTAESCSRIPTQSPLPKPKSLALWHRRKSRLSGYKKMIICIGHRLLYFIVCTYITKLPSNKQFIANSVSLFSTQAFGPILEHNTMNSLSNYQALPTIGDIHVLFGTLCPIGRNRTVTKTKEG